MRNLWTAPRRTRRLEQREARVGDNKETASVEEEPPEGMESKEQEREREKKSKNILDCCRRVQIMRFAGVFFEK